MSGKQSLRHVSAAALAEEVEALSGLHEWAETLERYEGVADGLAQVVPEALQPAAKDLRAEIEAFRPRVAVIGQVKAGKTALVNALLGMPSLLPSDVNPWTSVVTSAHLNALPADGTRAVFRFFDQESWSRLTSHGGRLGEMAERVGSADEKAQLADQIAELQRRSAQRLGGNYQLLLGREHRFNDVTPALLRRYVCLGDGEDGEDARDGRFADLTQSASIHLEAPEFGIPLTISDTPGVNDPFLVREQMTLGTLASASVCVLVLSAYQALTTVDLALIRFLRTMRPEQVIIFVNRVDELTDHEVEIPRIETMVRNVLSDHGIDAGARIVFGSARWAEMAALGDLEMLSPRDWEVVADPARGGADAVDGAEDDRRVVQDVLRSLSGIAELKTAIGERIAEGPAREELSNIERGLRDLTDQAAVLIGKVGSDLADCDEFEIEDRLDEIAERAERRLTDAMTTARGAIENLQSTVVAPWIETTADRLAVSDEDEVDPAVARDGMIREYEKIARMARASVDAILKDTAKDLRALYERLLPGGGSALMIVPPAPPSFPRPTAFARSTSFDLSGGWADRLLGAKRRGRRRAERFRSIAVEEFRSMLSEVDSGALAPGFSSANRALHKLVMPHVSNIQTLVVRGTDRRAVLDRIALDDLGRLVDLRARLDGEEDEAQPAEREVA